MRLMRRGLRMVMAHPLHGVAGGGGGLGWAASPGHHASCEARLHQWPHLPAQRTRDDVTPRHWHLERLGGPGKPCERPRIVAAAHTRPPHVVHCRKPWCDRRLHPHRIGIEAEALEVGSEGVVLRERHFIRGRRRWELHTLLARQLALSNVTLVPHYVDLSRTELRRHDARASKGHLPRLRSLRPRRGLRPLPVHQCWL